MGYRDLIYNPQILKQGISKEQVIRKVVDYSLNPEQLERDIQNLQANFKKVVVALTQNAAKQWILHMLRKKLPRFWHV